MLGQPGCSFDFRLEPRHFWHSSETQLNKPCHQDLESFTDSDQTDWIKPLPFKGDHRKRCTPSNAAPRKKTTGSRDLTRWTQWGACDVTCLAGRISWLSLKTQRRFGRQFRLNMIQYLVGGSEHDFYSSHLLGMSSSQLTLIFFRGVAQPPTRYISILYASSRFTSPRL